MRFAPRTDRPGIALLVVVLLTMVVAAIAAGAALIGANSFLINEYDQKQSLLTSVADAGLELGRARLNANPGLFPTDTGYATLESNAPARDAAGQVIEGVIRSVYAGPIGGGPGEYGTFGALIAVARQADGTRLVRRLDLSQSSFAAYAYFTHVEPTGLAFANNDQLYGPVHSNSNIRIRETGATFHGDVTTAGAFEGAQYATFLADTASGVTPILMPSSADISRLESRASPGYLAFSPTSGGTAAQSTMRLDFVARDVDGDGVPEGFVRVYQSSNTAWVSGHVWAGFADQPTAFANTWNCGHFESNGRFFPTPADTAGHSAATVLSSGTRRCFLGGADEIWNEFRPVDAFGQWRAFPGPVDPAVGAQPDGSYLYPLDRRFNPGFRGVIYVNGKVVVSGTVRARLTIAATGNIIIGDDLVYQTDPGAGTCQDMLGLFSGGQVIVADNTLNAPQIPPGSTNHLTYDDTRDEHVHAAILALDQFLVENASSGATSAEPCGTDSWGRGCLYVTGGIVQHTRGQVATGSGHGHMKRYTHDTCAFTDPPPYFPTTGHFARSRYYEVDPTGFDAAAFFDTMN